jgi:hypothetical protein
MLVFFFSSLAILMNHISDSKNVPWGSKTMWILMLKPLPPGHWNLRAQHMMIATAFNDISHVKSHIQISFSGYELWGWRSHGPAYYT